jgi:hypothetical protein
VNSKVYHYADKADSQGGVSALCYAKPRRIDLNRASWTIRPDAVTCPKCRAKLADKAPKCAVRGVIRPGAMCGAVIVGGELCGFKGKCEHQRPLGVRVAAPSVPPSEKT